MIPWDLSCRDWESKIRAGRTPVASLPLFREEADAAVSFFNAMRLPDVVGTPFIRDACGDWFREIVAAVFGSRDPATAERYVREFFAMAPKGSSKTTYGAALMVDALLMNQRPRALFLFVGPTQATSDRALSQAIGIIELDPALKRRFQIREHLKEIVDRVTRARLQVKTFDLNILTGEIPAGVLLDEIHVLGRHHATGKVLRQIRGGLEKSPDGFLIIITTQSDEIPAGAFREELTTARNIRDGRATGRMLPILFELPEAIARDATQWQNPNVWHMVMPNLGRSVHLDSLIGDWDQERQKGEHAVRIWASQHLNIEIGIGLKTDRWAGADYWERRADRSLTLDALLKRCEAVAVGIDGGGLDDLFGLVVLGRERTETQVTAIVDGTPRPSRTKRWLLWSHGWCHRGVLERRASIATRLQDFANAGELTIVDDELGDVSGIVSLIERVQDAGLLAGVAVDPAGLGELVDALDAIEVTQENDLLIGVGQGYRMMNAIKTGERRLANGTLIHSGSALMAWCVANLKIEPTATAIRATKQNAGDAKIDVAMAMFDAIDLMSTNPEAAGRSIFDDDDSDSVDGVSIFDDHDAALAA